jgi:hypothetical protein
MPSRRESTAAAVAFLAMLVAPAGPRFAGEARADEASYGRVEGDVTAVAGAGVVAAARGARVEGELRLRYLESAGVFAAYEDGAAIGAGAEPLRVLAVGLELRPLFLYRWLQGHELERPRLDLVVDSFALELGAAFVQPAGRGFASGTGIQAGIGLELPLLERVSGPWIGLHGGVRWAGDALAAGSARAADDREVFVALTLAWHQLFVAHWVDLGDRAPQ